MRVAVIVKPNHSGLPQEIEILSQCHHRNIAPLLHSVVEESHYGIILPYLQRNPKGGTTRTQYARDILQALQYLHESLGVLHGDIKPDNIMYSAEEGRWMLIDFNHAEILPAEPGGVRKVYGVRGTRGFMAPEVENETEGYDEAIDMWSLGRTLQVCFGTPTCSAEPSWDALRKLVQRLLITKPTDRPSARMALQLLK